MKKNAEKAAEVALPAVQELKIEGTSALTLMDNMDKLLRVGSFMISSGLMPSGIKSAANAALVIWTGHELGLKPMQAIQFINIISGKPTLAPVMMRSLIINSGTEEIWEVRENTEKVCTIYAKRKTGMEYTRSFTIEEASKIMSKEDGKTIPLTQKFNWKNMPATMLLWRCTSAVCRVVYPDVINGMYIPDEMEDAHVAYDDIEVLNTQQPAADAPVGTIVDVEAEPAAESGRSEPAAKEGELMLTPKHLEDIRAKLKETKSDEAKLCAAYKVPNLKSLPDAAYEGVVEVLERKRLKMTTAEPAKQAAPVETAKPAAVASAKTQAADDDPSRKTLNDVIDFLKGSNISYTVDGDVINCGKSFKHKSALTSIGFAWDGDRQGFVYKAAA